MTAVLRNHSSEHSFYHPEHTSRSYSTSPSASHRSIFSHKHSLSERTMSSTITSVSSTSTSLFPSTSAEHPVTSGKLHKRSQSCHNPAVTSTTEESDDFFASSRPKKSGIKPLLQRVSHSSGKLDLGKEDGGAGGQYYISSSPYIGNKSSATDLNSFVPTHRQHHKRTISSNSASSIGSTNLHPRRYFPTPNASYPNSIGDESDASDDDSTLYTFSRHSTSALRTGSYVSPFTQQPTKMNSSGSSTPISPMSPIMRSGTLGTVATLDYASPPTKKQKIYGSRDSSEEYAESVRAARAAFEAREQKKEEKEERKRRSFTRDREKVGFETMTVTSSTEQLPRPRWAFGRSSTPTVGTIDEKTIGVPYSSDTRSASVDGVRDAVFKGVTDERLSRVDEQEKSRPGGLKNQWMGFVVWLKFGMVKLSRKVQKLF